MSWSLKLITVRGIPIRVHASFLLILLWAAYIGLVNGAGNWLQGAAFMTLLVLLLFLCVVLHELGHSLVAQLFGVQVHDITLWPIGGIARLAKMPERPHQEFLITAAGPAVNIALAIGLTALALIWIGPAALVQMLISPWELQSRFSAMNGQTLVLILAANNALLALFNLIPALPMDGGRLLRSGLAAVLPFGKATRIASIVGQILAVLMGLVAILLGNFVLGLVAIFVFAAAGQERQGVRATEALRNLCARQAMQPLGLRLHPLQTLGEALSQAAISPQPAFPVVEGGRLLGLITRSELLNAARRQGAAARLNAHVPRDYVRLAADALLSDARDQLQGRGAAVVIEDGRAVGILNLLDLARVAEAMEIYHQALTKKPK